MKSVFVILGLLVCTEAAGSRAQTAVFVKTGEDLHLQLKEAHVPEDFIVLSWGFNGSVNLVSFLPAGEPRVSDLYSGRVEVSVENFSVKLKNLQKSDSGVYTARVIDADKSPILCEYLVTVEDPVSPVKLTVDSVTDSSNSCDLTVTCRSLDSHQISISTTVTCDNTTCSQEGGERSKVTTSGATLHAYLLNDTIICNYSNQISRTDDSITINHFCPRHTGPRSLNTAFVRKGADLLLQVKEADVPKDFYFLQWKAEGLIVISFSPKGESTVSRFYTGRAETSAKRFSLKLKYIDEYDSGLYVVRVAQTDQTEKTLVQYRVTVVDEVSPLI